VKVEPISESKPGTTTFEADVRSGKVQIVAKGALRGWRVGFGKETHRILLPPGGGGSLLVDDASVHVGRLRFHKVVSFPLGSHSAAVEFRILFEPVGRWARGGSVRRTGVIGFLAGLFAAGAAGGVAAGMMPTRRTRLVASLLVDGVGAGAWMSTTPTRAFQWEYVAAEGNPDAASQDWGERHAQRDVRYPTSASETVDDVGLATAIRAMVEEGPDRWIRFEPAKRRAFVVALRPEPGDAGALVVVARIPHGPGNRRNGLVEMGWAVEADVGTGTRYFVRRFGWTGLDGPETTIAEVRTAYAALYGQRLRFDRWTFTSGRSETASYDF
jgi:hypothetical protein